MVIYGHQTVLNLYFLLILDIIFIFIQNLLNEHDKSIIPLYMFNQLFENCRYFSFQFFKIFEFITYRPWSIYSVLLFS